MTSLGETNKTITSIRGEYVVFGNCQAPFVADFLEASPGFSEKFRKRVIPGVHEMTPEQFSDFKNSVGNVALFIFQNVKRPMFDTDSILQLLPERCIKISIPSLFFNAYNPEVTYIRESHSNIVYHDRLQLKLINCFEKYQTALIESQDYYPEEFSEKCLELSLTELKRREVDQKIDIPVSDYIEARFRDERLFHVLNHPSKDLLKLLSGRILKYLGIDERIDINLTNYNLDQWQFPIYKSHFLNLNLKFDNPACYVWDGERLSPKDFFSRQIKYYSTLLPATLAEQSFHFRSLVIRRWDLAAEFDYPTADFVQQ